MNNVTIETDSGLSSVFMGLLEEYVQPHLQDRPKIAKSSKNDETVEEDLEIIRSFLRSPCGCGQSCERQFSVEQLRQSRSSHRRLTIEQKNCFILAQLNLLQRSKKDAVSGRTSTPRTRNKYEYRISSDRPVCRAVFLFYYGESLWRLKSLQKHLTTLATTLPIHGNTRRKPIHAMTLDVQEAIESFIINYAYVHGLPDPGRDLRAGKGRLRILLPAVMTYEFVHKEYVKSVVKAGTQSVGYHSFTRIWHKRFPHIGFMRSRTDLCMKCEDFKKKLNQIAGDLGENRESEKIEVHQQAVAHLKHARTERDHYRECIKSAEEQYSKLSPERQKIPGKPNSRSICAHYSWDFAQHVTYPYENQQVGPIYFKSPRKAHIFGVCCEAIPRQVNYLIDEADFTEKNSATIISLLDHFFTNHALGEKVVQLTADNCVAQNKNNAFLQYLMYRVLTGLHDRIELSFMVVGHTKFAPDGYFGLIKKKYRRSNVYTYDQMANVIETSTANSNSNVCQRYRLTTTKTCIKYRDWPSWLGKYFTKLPNITRYYHFIIDKQKPGIVTVKKSIDGDEAEHNITAKKIVPLKKEKIPRLPTQVVPPGLTPERAWYLYDKIREHIPALADKDDTCPKPSENRQAKK